MGLYIDAGLTTALVLLVLGGLAWAEGQGRRYWPFLVAALPLGPALGYLVEAPPGRWLGRASPLGAVPFLFFLPLALQEVTKLLPLIVPSWRAALADRRGALIAGLALGTGFGIGQMWYLAWGLGREAPLLAAQPFWYSLGEFGAEGLLSSFFQATATALLTASLSRGHPRSGYLLAVGYRALSGLGGYLHRWGKWSLAASAWWLALPIALGMGALLFLILQAAREEVTADEPAPEWGMALLREENRGRGEE